MHAIMYGLTLLILSSKITKQKNLFNNQINITVFYDNHRIGQILQIDCRKEILELTEKKKRVIKPYNLVTKIFRLVDSWLQ